MLQSERRVLQDQNELNALDKLLKQFDDTNADEQEQCMVESEKQNLLRQCRAFDIDLYEEAKSIFMSAQTNRHLMKSMISRFQLKDLE